MRPVRLGQVLERSGLKASLGCADDEKSRALSLVVNCGLQVYWLYGQLYSLCSREEYELLCPQIDIWDTSQQFLWLDISI